MSKGSLIVSFKNMLDRENIYVCLVCPNSVFTKMNNYAKKQWGEEYKGDYDFSVKKDLQEVSALFFADYELADELEKKYGKHNTGSYELEKHINYHNIVQVEKDLFPEFIEQWKLTLKKLSGKEVQVLNIIPANKHNPSKELNEAIIF